MQLYTFQQLILQDVYDCDIIPDTFFLRISGQRVMRLQIDIVLVLCLNKKFKCFRLYGEKREQVRLGLI